jgi:hypothetical protein
VRISWRSACCFGAVAECPLPPDQLTMPAQQRVRLKNQNQVRQVHLLQLDPVTQLLN